MKFLLTLLLLVSFLTLSNAEDAVMPSAALRFEQRDAAAVPDFQKHVVPLFGRLGCNSAKCHGSFQGQADFRLSLFGFDFEADHAALHAEATTEDGNRLTLDDPDESLIVLKPSLQIDHEGGERFEVGSWEHNLLLRWIESGANGAEFGVAERPESDQSKFPVEDIAFFRDKIQPLFEDNCYECHGFNNREGSFQLKTRELILEGGNRGPAIVPGDPERSLLIQAVRFSDDELQMPQGGKLEDSEIALLEDWVRMGAPWPDRYEASAGDTSQILVGLEYEPQEILLSDANASHQIRVIAEWESGEREDVTCLTRFQSNDPAVATVDRNGLVTSTGNGDTHIVAMYDNGVAAIPVLRPYASGFASAKRHPTDAARKLSTQTVHPIDQFVDDKLAKLGLVPSAICTDAEFLRRVSIDMTGTLPTPDEISEFLSDTSTDKRVAKIDELLERTTYAAWWTNKICDFTGCNPASIANLLFVAQEQGYVKASQWYDWIYERIDRNVPYDEVVKGIMLADISSPVGEGMPHFWTRQSLEEPKNTAMSVAHSFLGIQLQCAECHKHPFDAWTQADFSDFSRFFESVTPNHRASANDEPLELSLLRSRVVTLSADDDPRQPIMDWMSDDENPWFARAFVNRVWAGYFHVGIVDPPDQFTPANPPSNPGLLDWLTRGFINSGYDMKWLHRQIVTSETYQRGWKPNETNMHDRRNYSRAVPRRIPAEVIYDAMKQATATTDRLNQVRTDLQLRATGHLSMRMAGSYAMKVFGKPARSIMCDCERVNEPTLLQAVFVQNDPLVRMRLADSGWIIELEEAEEAGEPVDKREAINQVWLRTVNRFPTDKEVTRSIEHLGTVDSIAEGITDLMWAMFNTTEFLLNH